MPPVLPALTAAVALLAIPSLGHAGGYVSAGVGSGPSLGGELDVYLDGDTHRSGRLAVGHRMGPFSIEAGLHGFGVHGVVPGRGGALDGSALSLAASVKGQIPLFLFVDGYARLGLQRTWITSDAEAENLQGTGVLIGLGLEVPVPVVPVDAAIWLEVSREALDLEQGSYVYDGTADVVMLGVRFGV